MDVGREAVAGGLVGLIQGAGRNGICQIGLDQIGRSQCHVVFQFFPVGDCRGILRDRLSLLRMEVIESGLFGKETVKIEYIKNGDIARPVRKCIGIRGKAFRSNCSPGVFGRSGHFCTSALTVRICSRAGCIRHIHLRRLRCLPGLMIPAALVRGRISRRAVGHSRNRGPAGYRHSGTVLLVTFRAMDMGFFSAYQRSRVTGVRVLVVLRFLPSAGEHILITFIRMLMGLDPAGRFALHCDRRQDQRVGGYEYNHTRHDADHACPNPSQVSVSQDLPNLRK